MAQCVTYLLTSPARNILLMHLFYAFSFHVILRFHPSRNIRRLLNAVYLVITRLVCDGSISYTIVLSRHSEACTQEGTLLKIDSVHLCSQYDRARLLTQLGTAICH